MLTTDQTIQALTDAFNEAGIDTPQKVQTFVKVAALQVKLNSLGVQLTKIGQAETAAREASQQEREAVQAEQASTQAALLALIAQE